MTHLSKPVAASLGSLCLALLLAACGGGGDDPSADQLSTAAAQGKSLGAAEGEAPSVRALLLREPLAIAGPLLSPEALKSGVRSARHRFFITDLGTLGGSEAFAYAINDKTQVVGISRVAGDSTTHKFLYSSGRMTDLFPLDSEDIQTGIPTGINAAGVVASGVISGGLYMPALMDTAAGAIDVLPCFGGGTDFGFSGVAAAVNNLGVAVGYCYAGSSIHAFVHSSGATTDINGLAGSSVASAVNDDGVVTGALSPQPGAFSTAFVYRGGVMSQIFPTGTESYGRSINRHGHIVGEYLTADGTAFRGFLYRDGDVFDIGSDDSRDITPLAINDRDEVVGVKFVTVSTTCSYGPCTETKMVAFHWDGREMAFLDSLIPPNTNWEINWASGINNRGEIVGYGTRDGKFRAFLLTPVRSPLQCRNGAWRSYGFSSQGECISWALVATL